MEEREWDISTLGINVDSVRDYHRKLRIGRLLGDVDTYLDPSKLEPHYTFAPFDIRGTR